jgi:signal transduction histidine kinase
VYPAPDGVTLVFQDVTARRRAQDASSFLAEASRLLASSLDYAATLRAVAEAAVPRLGDWCAVDIVTDPAARAWPPTVQRVAVVHQDAARLALGAQLTTQYPTDWSASTGAAMVLRTGTPFFVPTVTDAMLVAGARDAEHLRLLRALEFSSILVVPLIARDLTLGTLTLCMTESGRRYDAGDLALAQDLAQRAAVAVDNARLFGEAERLRIEAQAANRAKSDFLAVMSHELRTPLNAIGGYVQLMEMGIRGPVTPEQRDDLRRVGRSQQHLLGLINDVLNFARLDAGRVQFEPVHAAVADTLAGVEALVAPQAAERGHRLEVVPCDPALTVWADPERTAQILVNLLTNAIKYTEPGGHIRVACVPDVDVRGDPVVRIVVRDTGVGVAPEKLEAIFDPFVQVGRRLNRPGDGVGLGLAISRDLARGMGGDLTAASTPDVGSTFTLTLPSTPRA